jgi:hypothetical protein
MSNRRENLFRALSAFVKSRPGLEFCNYGDVSSYRSELRSITKDRHHAEELMACIAWRDSITVESIIAAAQGAFSGRLSIVPVGEDGFRIEYCTGQYYPTEYRRAVCAVLSSALWDYWRANGCATGDAIRKTAARELSRSVANRWFR